ncbi:NADPH:quinone reductase [Eubacterium sp. 1001713B170207_170306_E7]|uniref:NADPH:quinone reductase n=1 Tax=Eubacterium sp. 1001713B170207_170306_E7 TaxID=2787097 RepID=UPI001896C33D|nr:NADPH:quinone reductase [Eubacterium sp. 1001713B170207_170306_E7]
MKAIIVSSFGDEEVLKYQETATPVPAAHEVRVKMEAVGVNPVETYIRSGHYPALPTLPYTPGNDGAGIVDAVGEDVERLKEGDRVFVAAALARHNSGTYAEYVVCDAGAVRPLPESLSFSEGAALGTPGLAATYALYSKAKLKPGETVFIHGASGGVGSLAVQLARRTGAYVLGTAGNPEGMALVKKLGAHRAFNHNSPDYIEAIKQETGGQGPNVIIEMVANVNLMKDMELLAKYGRVVIVGNHGTIEFDPRAAMTKDAVVMGMNIGNMPEKAYTANLYALSAAMESGLHTVIGKELPLCRAAQAHREVSEGKSGKVVLR